MLYTRFKIICLLFLLISFYLIGCSTKEPSDDLIKRQISGLLTKDTTGKLFDVTSVQIESKHLTKEGDFIVNAQYTLRYTSSLADYLTYLFENTNIDSRIDGAEVKKEVQAEIIKKYGRPQAGSTRSFENKFIFRQEAFGWQIQSHRDYEKIKPFLP